ncbi:MAG: alpha/beta hydrolase [Kofleriaceae bacterium]|nr:alpha/beta hydrolase [Myxococcales bacterium]MCB9561582.1 alpha/beta hydrolase [Kofleriaceae bacterium]
MLRLTLLATALAPALAACGATEVRRDVAYDPRFGDATVMDLHLPDDGATLRPAVVMIHGGGWRLFSKDEFDGNAERLAGAGYVVANINYRLVPDGAYPAAVQDCLCALAYVRNHAGELGVDPDRVAVMGYSAGGHLAALLGVAADEPDFQPDCAEGATGAPRAVISGAGPTDLIALADADTVQDFVGGTVDEVPERYQRISPLYQVEAGAPPYLFVHGEDDLFVPLAQSQQMRQALRDVGTEATLLSLRGSGHLVGVGGSAARNDLVQTSVDTPEAWVAIIDFLDDQLGAP